MNLMLVVTLDALQVRYLRDQLNRLAIMAGYFDARKVI